MKEKIGITGTFFLKVFENGRLIDQFEENNLVVTTGKEAAVLLLGGDGAGKQITNIGFGTSGAASLLSMTALTGLYSKALEDITYPAAESLKADFVLEEAENNGVTIQEFGLICSDGTLFSRLTRYPIEKTNSIRLEGSWIINL